MKKFKIIELSDNDWQQYMSIRLESLLDSPDSFGSTYEREATFSSDQWKSRLRISSTIHDAVAIAAVVDESFIGLLSSVIHTPETNSAHLYQMWVSPDYRGMGVGTALIDRIQRWAADKKVDKIQLSVTTINTQAISLYESIGFKSVGKKEPLREGSTLESQLMEITLNSDNV